MEALTEIKNGEVYGRLTVLCEVRSDDDHHRTYSCLCECGKKKNVWGTYLRCKKVRSCGCLKKEYAVKAGLKSRKDLTGNTYGDYTVLGCAGTNKYRKLQFEVKCKCGVVRVLSGNYLKANEPQCNHE